MIYLIYGEDNFRSEQKLNYLINFYKSKEPFYASFDFEDKFNLALDINGIKELLTSRTLFATTKLIVFKNFLANNSQMLKKDFFKLLNQAQIAKSKSVMLIIYEAKDINHSAVLQWFKKNARHLEEFSLLKGRKLEAWINEEARKLGLKLTKESLEIMVAGFGNDSGAIYHALKKLSLLKSPLIDKKTLEDNVWLPFSTNIFNFLDNLALGNFPLAFKLLIQEIKYDDSANNLLHILSMIAFEFRSLILIKESHSSSLNDIRRKTNLSSYTLTKIYPLSKKFTSEELKKIYARLSLCDERMKKGLLEPKAALELLLLDIKQILAR